MEAGKFLLIMLLIATGGAVPLILLLGLYLHRIMSKTLDSHLFNNNYFSEFELKTFNSFPLSILKTLAYIRGTVLPNTITKRFKGYNFRNQISPAIYWINAIWVTILFSTFIAIIIAFTGLAIDMFILN